MTCNDTVASNDVLVAIHRGDTLRLSVELTDAADKPVDVTGWSWRAQLRNDADMLAGDMEVTVVDALGGTLQLFIDQVDTAQLAVGDYRWDLEGTDTEATVRTLVTGKLRVRQDVTR